MSWKLRPRKAAELLTAAAAGALVLLALDLRLQVDDLRVEEPFSARVAQQALEPSACSDARPAWRGRSGAGRLDGVAGVLLLLDDHPEQPAPFAFFSEEGLDLDHAELRPPTSSG